MNNTLQFDGQSTVVEVDLESPTNNGGAITIEFWNKVDTNPPDANAFWFRTADAQKRVSCHAPWSNSRLYWDCGNPDHTSNSDTPGGRLDVDYSTYLGYWTHIALVSAGAGGNGGNEEHPCMAIYLNGELKAKSEFSASPDIVLKGLLIGAAPKGSTEYDLYHKGMIDGFRVWNYVRTAEEIKRDMRVELVGDEPGLVAYFNFNWGVPGSPDKSLEWVKTHPNEVHKNLPNMVPDGPDGVLKNFDKAKWVASGVDFKGASVGPVYELKKPIDDKNPKNGDYFFHTTKPKEIEKKITDGWDDQNIVFYAHRGPTPGTIPLYRLCQKTENEERYRLTIGTAERQKLDPRTEVKQAVASGAWEDEGEIAYVSASKNGDAVPLYIGYDPKTQRYRYTTKREEISGNYVYKGIAGYVLPKLDSAYKPKPISFVDNKLSEQLWYVLLCRSYKEKWGVTLDKDNNPVLAEIPQTGVYTRFQWRLENGLLINRALPNKALGIANNKPVVQDKKDAKGWNLISVAKRGTDCFSLVQGDQALQSDEKGTLSTIASITAGERKNWTFLAMDLLDGYTLQDPPIEHSGLPYSKYLPLINVPGTGNKTTVHILGTGTVSDWAMLRVKLIVENMLGALKKEVSTDGVNDMEVLVISKDDSNEEVTKYPCIGFLMRGDEKLIEDIRGGYFWAGGGSVCYVTEEMMWKTGVFNRPGDTALRYFDQVVHEFAHMMDGNLGFQGDKCPVASSAAGLNPSESYAISVQGWFNSITTTNPTYSPGTRKELKETYQDRYNYIARHFDPDNTWMPPIEPRQDPSLTTSPKPTQG